MNIIPDVVNDTTVNACGLVAGTIVAVAVLPQIYRVHKRGSGTDLSVTRQVVTGIGATMQIVYLVYFGLWAVVIPLGCQLIFIIYLSFVRAYFERFGSKREAIPGTEQNGVDTQASEDTNPTPIDARGRSLVVPAISQEPP